MRKDDRKKTIKRVFIGVTVAVIGLLLVIVLANASSMSDRKKELETKISELNRSIDEQNKKTTELEEYREYTKTREFTEEIAREKLGLVYPGEIVLRAE